MRPSAIPFRQWRLRWFAPVAFLLLAEMMGPSVPAQSRSVRIVDRIAAVVNGDVITESDIRWYLALDPELASRPEPLDKEVRALQQLIDQRLLHQEAEKLPTIEISPAQVEDYLAKLIARFPSESVFRQRIEGAGLDTDMLREIARHRLEILRFIDFRFRSFVFVSDQEIQSAYQQKVIAVARARGEEPPPLESVRGLLEKIISDEKVTSELIGWLDDARRAAEIILHEPYRSMRQLQEGSPEGSLLSSAIAGTGQSPRRSVFAAGAQRMRRTGRGEDKSTRSIQPLVLQ